jgi:hypothetical protein
MVVRSKNRHIEDIYAQRKGNDASQRQFRLMSRTRHWDQGPEHAESGRIAGERRSK